MSSYVGRHAALYDLFYADKPYADEAKFLHACLNKFGTGSAKNLLELACGTGRHAFELEKYGYQITASDYSPDMLERARERGKQSGSAVRFVEQNMESLSTPESAYDAIICLFDSIGYLKTNEALSRALAGVHRSLRSEGLFIFEFWHAAAMLSQYSPLRMRRWNTPDGEVIRISETTLDSKNQLALVNYTIYELKKDGTYVTFQEEHANRYFLVQEMQALLAAANLELLKSFNGFQENETIDSNAWHVVAVARKRDIPNRA